MTLRRHPVTRVYSADVRDRTAGRVHVSLKTKRKDEAMTAHAAVTAFVRGAPADLLALLRGRKLNVAAVVECFRAGRPWDSLRATLAWPTMREGVDQYLAWLDAHPERADSTRAQASTQLEDAVAFFGAATRLDAVTAELAEGWHQALLKRPVREGATETLQPQTVGLYLTRLATFYNWAAKREQRRAGEERRAARLLHNPVDAELVPKRNTGSRKRFLSAEEVARLRAATPPQLRFAIDVGLLTGLRVDEICHLRPPPHDIDLELGILYVQAREGWRPKTKKNREVPIADALRPVIEHHLAHYASAEWMMPAPTDPSAPMLIRTLHRYVSRVVRDAELIWGSRHPMGVTFHTFRHTFASWAVMSGVDLFTVAQLLGHSTTKMVEQTYGHLSPDHKRAAIARVATKLFVSPPPASAPEAA